MKKICMLIPGNPAVADSYHSWIGGIKDRNPDLDIVYATSYVLFDKKLNSAEYDAAMRGHYEKLFLELNAPGKVTIIAHSVGSYFALNLLQKYPERIERIIIMFPYIGYSTIRSLRFIAIPYFIDRFFPLVELLAKYKNTILRREKNIRDISRDEFKACFRFGVKQCAYFNGHKFDTASPNLTKDRIDFIYTDGDKWCPAETIGLLKVISNHRKVALPHDFISTPENRTKMIDELIAGGNF